ncbi:MAG: site-specific integrase [Pyrinomonadaceae bacterium]|nr:site-specific integrase [Sphingobacteriaceae bacterium]
MADVNYYLRDTTAQKETGVMLFFSYIGKRFKIATIERIEPKYWDSENQKARQTKSFPTYPEFNQRLKDVSKICFDVYRKYLNDHDQQHPQQQTIKDLIKAELVEKIEPEKPVNYTLTTFADHLVNEIQSGRRLTKKGQPLSNSIYKIFKTHSSVLKEFQTKRKKTILFDDCTSDFYHDFLEFLRTDKKYANNTIGKHIRTLKAILKAADKLDLCTKTAYNEYTSITEDVNNIYLAPEELNHLYTLDVKGNSRLDRVRDLFLVGSWTGLRFSDFSTIEAKHYKNGFIEMRMQKTGKEVVIPIHPTVEAIMDKYKNVTENGLPPALSNQKMNAYLKELGELAELTEVVQKEQTKGGKKIIINRPKHDLITTHTARRSFATNMYNMNVPSLTIMAITGHKTESNFMKYIKVTPKEHAIKLREIWNREIMKVV